MPKSKKVTQKTEPAEDMQKLNARAYASRLAKQVASEEKSRRPATPSKKRGGKELNRRLRNLCAECDNSERVGRRRAPIQLGLALAPALTCCLSAALYGNAHPTAGTQWAPELSRVCRGSSSLGINERESRVASSLLHVPHAFRPEFRVHFAVQDAAAAERGHRGEADL